MTTDNSSPSEGYSLTMIKQIVASEHDVLDRVIHHLVPQIHIAGATITDAERIIALTLLNTLLDNGNLTCPQCGAADYMDAAENCIGNATCIFQDPRDLLGSEDGPESKS